MAEAQVVVTGVVPTQAPPQVLKAFKKIPGKQHMHNGVELEDGDIILLNPNQAKAFADKLTPADGEGFKAMSAKDVADFEAKEATRRADRENAKTKH